MEENTTKETNVKATIDAVTGLAKAVPIYDDAIQPAAKETGKALESIAKTVNIALTPVRILIWGYDKIEGFLTKSLAEKLEHVPEDRIATPPIEVVGPAIESLRFTGHQEDLRNLFANLIANSMDIKTVKDSHPGFVEIIKNLSSEEAKILKLFATRNSFPLIDIRAKYIKNQTGGYDLIKNFSEIGTLSNCIDPQLVPNFLNNLCRLGLLEIPTGMHLTDNKFYSELEEHELVKNIKLAVESLDDRKIQFVRKYITLTAFGKQFCNVCVVDKA